MSDNNQDKLNPLLPDVLENWENYTPVTTEEYTGHSEAELSKYYQDIPYGQALEPRGFEARKHEQQGGLAQLGSALNQAIIGEIGGGTLEGIGYLLDIPQYADLIKGTEQEFGNWLSDIGKNVKEWTREATPIYADPFKQGEFSPEDWSWWMSNLPSVASTLSLMIPSGAAVKGLSMGAKALNIGKGLTQSTKWASKGVTQAVISRHMENMMESAGTMDGITKELTNQSVGKEQADLISKNYNIDLQKNEFGLYDITPEAANAIGAKAASSNYKANWAMLLQDIPQYLMLRTPFGKASRDVTPAISKMLGVSNVKPIVNKSASIVSDMLGEGAEEGYQFLAGERSRENALANAGLTEKRDFDQFLSEETKKGEFWTNAFFGAMGAGVMQTAGKSISNSIDRIKGIETDEQSRINDIQSWGNELKRYNITKQIGVALKNEDMINAAEEDIFAGMVVRAAQNGNIDAMKTAFKEVENMTEEEQKQLGMTPEDVQAAKERNPQLMKDIDRITELYESAANQHGANWGGQIASQLYKIEKTEGKINDYNAVYNRASSDIVNLNNVSSAKAEHYNLTKFQIPSEQDLMNSLTIAYNKAQEGSHKENLYKRLKEVEASIKEKKERASELLKNRTEEEKESDKNFKLFAPKNDTAKTALSKKLHAQEDLKSQNEYLNTISDPKKQKEADEELKKREKESIKQKVKDAKTSKEVKNIKDQAKGTEHEKTVDREVNEESAKEMADNKDAMMRAAEKRGSKLTAKKTVKKEDIVEEEKKPEPFSEEEKTPFSWMEGKPKTLDKVKSDLSDIITKYNNNEEHELSEDLFENVNTPQELADFINDRLASDEAPQVAIDAFDDIVDYFEALGKKRDAILEQKADEIEKEQPTPEIGTKTTSDLIGSYVELNDGTKGVVEVISKKTVKIRTNNGNLISKPIDDVLENINTDTIAGDEEIINNSSSESSLRTFKDPTIHNFKSVNEVPSVKELSKEIDTNGLNKGEYTIGDKVYFEVDSNNEFAKDDPSSRKIYIVNYKDGKRSVIGLVPASKNDQMLSMREQILESIDKNYKSGINQSELTSSISGFTGRFARQKDRLSALQATPKSEREKHANIGGYKLAYTKPLTESQMAWFIPREDTSYLTNTKYAGMPSILMEDVYGSSEYIPVYGYVKKMREYADMGVKQRELTQQLYKRVLSIIKNYNGENGKQIHNELSKYIILPGKVNLNDYVKDGEVLKNFGDLFKESKFNIDASKANSPNSQSHDLGFDKPVEGLYNAVVSDFMSFNVKPNQVFDRVAALISDSFVAEKTGVKEAKEPTKHMTHEELESLNKSTEDLPTTPEDTPIEEAPEGEQDGSEITNDENPELLDDPFGDIGLDGLLNDAKRNKRRKKTPSSEEISNYKKWDRETELKWFKENFPNVPIQVLDNLKEITKNGKELWGVFQNASVYISKNAGVGTVYHEAFHAVFNLFLDESQANDMLSLYAKESGLKAPKNESERIDIEEDMADAFADYVISNQNDTTTSKKINDFFRKLWLTIKSFFTNDINNVDEFFFKANNGFYANSRVKPGSFGSKVTRTKYPDWKQEQLKEVVESINKHIILNFLPSLQKTNEAWKDFTTTEMLNSIYNQYGSLDPVFKKVRNDFIKLSNQLEDKDVSQNLKKAANRLFDNDGNRGDLTREVIRALDYYNGIKVASKVIDAYDETDVNDDIERNDTQGIKENWQDSFTNRSRKQNAPTEVKEFIRYIETGEINFIGLPAYVNYEDTYNTLLNNLAGMTSLAEMREYLSDEYNQKNHPEFGILLSKIEGDPLFSSKFFNAFNSNKATYGMLTEKDGKFSYIIVNQSGVVKKIISDWSVKVDASFNKENAERLKKEYDEYAKKNKYSFDDLKRLNEITVELGVEVPMEALIRANENNKIRKILFGNASIRYIVNSLAKGENPFDKASVYGESKAIRKTAKFIADSMPSLSDDSFTNIDGETMHSYIVPNFLSKLTSRLRDPNQTKEVVNWFRQDPIFKNNVILNEMYDKSDNMDSLQESFDVHILNGVRTTEGSFSHKTMSESERLATSLNLYYNNGNKDFSMYEGPVLSDAPNMIAFRFKRFPSIRITEKVVDNLVDLAQSEYESIKARKAWKGVEVENYDTRDIDYQIMPMFNNFKGEPIKNYTEAKKVIMKYMNKKVHDLHNKLKSEGVVVYDKKDGTKLLKGEGMLSKDIPVKTGEDMHKFLTDYYYDNFLVRSHFSLMTVGDPAFYKPSKGSTNRSVDYSKRAKEIYSPKFIPDLSAKYIETIELPNRKTVRNPIGVSATYKNVYIKDANIKAPSYDSIETALSQAVKNKYINEDQKSDILKAYGVDNKGNGKVNQTDAQAYITLPFYRETMISLGRWTDKHQRAYHRLRKGEGTSGDISLVMQPLKPFTYGMVYDKERGKLIPVQNKNSEYLILPQMLEEGSQLKKLHDFMLDKNVGVANFESAVKVGLSKVTDIDNLNEEHIQILNTEDRGIQMETPEHFIDSDNLFGTQIRKLILADLNSEAVYETKDGTLVTDSKELQEKYEEIILADLMESYDSAKKEFVTEDGEIDYKKIANLLRDEARSRGKGEEFEKAIEYDPISGNLKLNLFHPLYGKMTQSLLTSIFRSRVTNQKIKGGAMIQATSFGFSKELKLVMNDKGGLDYAEIMLPAYAKDFFKDFIDENGNVDFKKAQEELPSEIFDMVGYRIPTEDKYSMLPLKVVGFLPLEAGGAIMLPAEITTISGSDFDVDKMYIMMREYKRSTRYDYKKISNELKERGYSVTIKDLKSLYDKVKNEETLSEREIELFDEINLLSEKTNEELKSSKYEIVKYDWSKKASEQSKQARNNAKIDAIEAVLTNNATLSSLFTPGGYDHVAEAVDLIKSKSKDSDSDSAVMDIITAHALANQNMVGKALVGIAANHNAHNALRQLGELYVEPILFDGITNANRLSVNSDGNFKAITQFKFKNNKFEKVDANRTITKNISEFLAAIVDNAKDPLVAHLNYNEITSDVYSLIISTGFDTITASSFMVQPSIKKFVELMKSGKNDREALSEVAKLTNGTTKGKYGNINTEELVDAIGTDNLNTELQRRVLTAFAKYYAIGKDLNSLIGASRADTKGLGSTLAHGEVILESIDDILNKEFSITGAEAFINGTGNNSTLINSFTEYGVRKPMDEILSKILPYNDGLFREVKSVLNEFNPNGFQMTADQRNHVNDKVINYILSTFDYFNADERGDLIYKFPKQLIAKIKTDKNLQNNAFVKRLIVTPAKYSNSGMAELTVENSGKISNEMRVDMQRAFEDLFNSEYSDIAHKLVKYSYFTSGLNFTPTGYSQLISTSVYLDYIKDSNNRNTSEHLNLFTKNDYMLDQVDEFIDQFYKNSSSDRRFVPQIEESSHIGSPTKKKGKIISFLVNMEQHNPAIIVSGKDKKPAKYVYLIKENALFKKVDVSEDNIVVYEKTNTLGKKNFLNEYISGMGSDMESITETTDAKTKHLSIKALSQNPVEYNEVQPTEALPSEASIQAKMERFSQSRLAKRTKKVPTKKDAEKVNKNCKGGKK
jgi:hypothetical protein